MADREEVFEKKGRGEGRENAKEGENLLGGESNLTGKTPALHYKHAFIYIR